MKVKVTSGSSVAELDAPTTEEGFWKTVSEAVFNTVTCPDIGETPLLVTISCERGEQVLGITARGTYHPLNSPEKPSPFVIHEGPWGTEAEWVNSRSGEGYNDPAEAFQTLCRVGGEIALDNCGDGYTPRYLAFCSPNTDGGHGSYKYYRLDVEAGSFVATYGRIGQEGRSGWGPVGRRRAKPIPSWMFWPRYREKLAKGYKDLSDVYLAGTQQELLFAGLTEEQVTALEAAGISSVFDLMDKTASELAEIDGLDVEGVAAKMQGHGMPLKTEDADEPDKASESSVATPINEVSAELYELLQGQASELVFDLLETSAEEVTAAMVVKARELIQRLVEIAASKLDDADKVSAANEVIIETMLVSPRRADTVSRLLVDCAAEISDAINRENALADSMEAVVTGRQRRHAEKGKVKEHTISFDDFGVDVRLATEAEVAEVKALMLDPYTGNDTGGYIRRVTRIWRVEPRAQRAAFERHVEQRDISDIRQLFHGSSFGSWFSCIANGLSLAYANGGMFGSAHYFANQFRKSDGYTDGSWWGRGGARRRRSYIGVYDVAYGNAMQVKHSDSGLNYKRVDGKGYDSVHAYKGPSSQNDEIMVYSDQACCIRYLIEYES